MKMDINIAYSNFLKAIENLNSVGNIVAYKDSHPSEFSSLMLSVASFFMYIKRHASESQEITSNSYQIIINTLSKYPELEGLKNTLLIDTL
ncbi:MAG: hypothetical protein E7167_03125 [Firmicutes bacterium]|nr:hypothetical protein [Bacillota bacterium]